MLNKIDVLDVVALAKTAGEAIMEIYQKDFEVEFKRDESPLTEADKAAHEIIEQGLKKLDKNNNTNIPFMSEEGKSISYEERKNWEYYWLVDPVDGTKEFVKKNGEFTVNIALIENGVPVLGVVYAPALGETYWSKKGKGAFKDGVQLPLRPASQKRLATSPTRRIFSIRSASLKVKPLFSPCRTLSPSNKYVCLFIPNN
jgi:3'(2'), 5'-bisphosphate nucleotidase